MEKLFCRAKDFIYRHARALDVARFQYHFENGSAENVMKVLRSYQNEDGGIGHAVEADCWNPHSSPIQTWAATGIIREIGITDGKHLIIQGILRYLESGAAFDGHTWAWGIPSNNDYPHAPWWHVKPTSKPYQSYNPSASLAGFLVRYAAPESSAYALGKRIAEEAYQYFMVNDVQDCHECRCFAELLDDVRAAGMESDIFDADQLEEKLCQRIACLITKDSVAWENTYACMPSFFIRGAKSPFLAGNEDWAEAECDFLRRTQQADGGWAIHWHWGAYPEEWAISKMWWRGQRAVDNLLYLRGMEKF